MPARQPTFAKFGPQKRENYLQVLREGARRGEAAKGVGVSAELVRQYRHRFPDFDGQALEAEEMANELVEGALFRSAVNGNVVACQVWLYNRKPEMWADRRNTRHAEEAEGPIDIVRMTSDEQMELLREARDEADRRLRVVDGVR
jgi:hypothetical protein